MIESVISAIKPQSINSSIIVLTAHRETKSRICTKQNTPTPFVFRSHGGIRGSLACHSIARKPKLNIKHEMAKSNTIGWPQGSFCPPRLRSRRKVIVEAANVTVPSISRWRNNDAGSPLSMEDCSFGLLRECDGSCHAAKQKQTRAIGAWPVKDLYKQLAVESSQTLF